MRRRQAGFAVLDAMVAVAVVAGTLGAMLDVLADGAGRSRMTEARRLGLLVAQSRLAAVGTEVPLRAGAVSGVDGDFAWSVGIGPYRVGAARSDAGDLLLVTVLVRPRTGWGKTVELRSLRLAPAG
ncbi:hypothetical protein [Magnetospirillum sp. 15-1]|uniref:hypothetical protein n=1 Tax=Magnetospirillum sp. 15-1 TaxID=1979370 RepID=UPI000BBC3DD3|nr:hypothetical protein [Magnetospirillum sp. 15-1]